VMTALGKANWWAPKFMRPKAAPRHAAPPASEERVLERV